MGRYISTAIVPLVRTVSASSAVTAEANDRILADTTTAGFIVTLPAAPLEGDTIQIIDVQSTFATNSLTVARNGNNISSTAEDLTVDVNGVILSLQYVDAAVGWLIVSS